MQTSPASAARPVWCLLQSRLYGEAINIFCQGASLQSFQLLWRLRLLDEVMLPYAEYARMHKVSR